MKTKTIKEKIIHVLKNRKLGLTTHQLAEKVQHPDPSVRRTLLSLRRIGMVRVDRRWSRGQLQAFHLLAA